MEHTYTADEQREHRKLWVEALRSGKYQQGKGVLRNPGGGMCCLGVACEISGLVAWAKEPYGADNGAGFGPIIDGEQLARFYAPQAVANWLGLSHNHATYGPPASITEFRASLANDNDDGKTFAEIADIIEAEPEGLVVK